MSGLLLRSFVVTVCLLLPAGAKTAAVAQAQSVTEKLKSAQSALKLMLWCSEHLTEDVSKSRAFLDRVLQLNALESEAFASLSYVISRGGSLETSDEDFAWMDLCYAVVIHMASHSGDEWVQALQRAKHTASPENGGDTRWDMAVVAGMKDPNVLRELRAQRN